MSRSYVYRTPGEQVNEPRFRPITIGTFDNYPVLPLVRDNLAQDGYAVYMATPRKANNLPTWPAELDDPIRKRAK